MSDDLLNECDKFDEDEDERENQHSSRMIAWLMLSIGLLLIVLLVAIPLLPDVRHQSGSSASRPDPISPRPVGPKRESPEPRGSGKKSGPDLADLIESYKPSIVLIQGDRGSRVSEGTGFAALKEGLLITNAHVIADTNSIRVMVGGQKWISAEVVKRNDDLDLAILRMEGEMLPLVKLGSTTGLRDGDKIAGIGFPLGSSLGTKPKVTEGVVSTIDKHEGVNTIQFTAPVNPGNSGGPLISVETGKVVGVITAKARNGERIGFAVTIDYVKDLLP